MLSLCLTVPGFSMIANAADGKIMFTDPTTAVGETLELKGVVQSDETVGYAQVIMTYDTSVLKFTDGDNVTETAAGQLTFTNSGAQTNRIEYLMHFEVLQEGTTKVEVQACNVDTVSGEDINCTEGSSTITITGEGGTTEDPTVETPDNTSAVEVNGVSYTFTSEFSRNEIPDGFSETTIEYDGLEYKVVDNGAVTLGYLVDAEGTGDFFMYNSENATFASYVDIAISESTTIAILSDVEDIVLPEEYSATTISVNGVDFPAWQNMDDPDFCILYAVNNKGETSLYKMDYYEGTYQRFEAPEVEKANDSLIGKLSAVLQNHLDWVILGTGLGFILFVVIIIVLAVKLANRNAELDELYEEYGFGFDDDDDKAEVKPVVRQPKKEKVEKEEEDFIRIDEEVEEDVALEEEHLAEVFAEEETAEDDSEVEVEFYEQKAPEVKSEEKVEEIEEIQDEVVEEPIAKTQVLKAPIRKVKEEKKAKKEAVEEYFDDEDDLDFEMDFIDLDD